MPNEPNVPLYLHQVLEEEYQRLHNQAPPSFDRNAKSEARLTAILNDIHRKKHSAICLSGGGIRSATFALGVIQALACKNLLEQFSYLSTVSGGGYVGGWLSAWIHREPLGAAGVTAKLKAQPKEKLMPEPDPVRHLRSYSNYLTPRLGILSADTWTLAAIILRNLILNWLVLVPMLLVVLALPRFCVAVIGFNPTEEFRPYALGAVLLLAFVGGVISITYAGIRRPSSTQQDTTQREFLWRCLAPLLASAVFLVTFWAWFRPSGLEVSVSDHLTGLVFGGSHYSLPFIIFGTLLYLSGWLIYSSWLGLFSFWKPGWFARLDRYKLSEFAGVLCSGALGGVFLWLVAAKVFPNPNDVALFYVSFAAPLYLVLFLMTAILFAGVSSEYTGDEDREWWARFNAWVLIAIVGWSAISFLVLIAPGWLMNKSLNYVVPAGGLIGLLTTFLARSAMTPAAAKQEQKAGWWAVLMSYALPLGALLFIALLVVLLSFATNYLLAILTLILDQPLFTRVTGADWLRKSANIEGGLDLSEHISIILDASLPLLAVLVGIIGALGYFLSRWINTNKFSQHAMYRNRLIRAYLGASNKDRKPNLFTGFDAEDNIPMHELRPELFHTDSFSDIKGLVRKLRNEENELSSYFKRKLSPDTIKHLDECDLDSRRPPSQTLQRALIRDFNNLLRKGDSIHDDTSGFESSGVSKQVDELVNKYNPKLQDGVAPDGRAVVEEDALILLNRRLVELAFPDEVHKCPEPPHRPMHIVNMALNLVSGKDLAWQDRKAASFTVSPLHAGSCQIPDYEDENNKQKIFGSYRRSKEYGGKQTGGISLGTAVAISGAAVSPNMGYYSSLPVTFLMTLFNVRLGWWLGNPGKAGSRSSSYGADKATRGGESGRPGQAEGEQHYYQVANPKSSAYPIVAEALGLTDDDNSYVYLSDGGHFENLGLYEMVLRRCHIIVVSDASDDFEFKLDNLGNAIRKIRIDFGIPIKFDSMFIYPRSKNQPGAFCAVGDIRYSQIDEVDGVDEQGKALRKPAPDGRIIYIKPVFYGDEPRDIYHYAQANKRFPHEFTGDQWFSEEQFESYRSLGSHIVEKILGEENVQTLEDFLARAEAHLSKFKDSPLPRDAKPSGIELDQFLSSASEFFEKMTSSLPRTNGEGSVERVKTVGTQS